MPFNPKPGTSGTGTNQAPSQSYLGQLGLSTDNPDSGKVQTAVQALLDKGYTTSQINSVISAIQANPNANAQNINISTGLYNKNLPNDWSLFQGLSDAQSTAKTWEGNNAGTSASERGLYQQQVDTAAQFKTNIPKLEYNLTQQAAEAQKQMLATAIEGTKNNYNARGLLFSTAEQGAEAANSQQAAANVEQARAGINQAVENTGNELNQAAIDTGNALTGLNQSATKANTDLTSQYNSLAEQNAALQQQALGAIGQGIGGIAGTAVSALTNPAKGAKTPESPFAGLSPAAMTPAPAYNPSSGLGAANFGGIV